MKVWVIMGNDFPDAVFLSEESANKYVDEKKKLEKKKAWPSSRVYWRANEFEAKP